MLDLKLGLSLAICFTKVVGPLFLYIATYTNIADIKHDKSRLLEYKYNMDRMQSRLYNLYHSFIRMD
jgi:hypothetical protein